MNTFYGRDYSRIAELAHAVVAAYEELEKCNTRTVLADG